MREIKFRAWFDGEMHSHEDLVNMDQETHAVYTIITHEEQVDGDVFMQYTDLKDKNGREIYEGDIIQTWEENEPIPVRDDGGGIIDYDHVEGYSQLGVVEFKEGWFAYSTKKHLKGRKEQIYAPICFTENVEVVGNVFENPELLEAQE